MNNKNNVATYFLRLANRFKGKKKIKDFHGRLSISCKCDICRFAEYCRCTPFSIAETVVTND